MKTRTTVIWIFVILVVTGLVFGVPPIVKYQIEKNLTSVLSQPVSIEQLNFNPFVGTATVKGIQVGNATSLQDAAVNIEIWPLLDRHIHIQSLALSQLSVPVTVVADQLSIADYSIPSGAVGETDAETDSKTEPKTESETWRVSLDSLLLEELEVALDYESSSQQIQVKSLELSAFDTFSGTPTSIQAALALNGAPIAIDGRFIAQSGAESFTGKVNIEQLDLNGLAMQTDRVTIPKMTGTLSLEQFLEIDNTATGPTASGDGNIALEGFSGFGAAIGNFSWQGSADFSALVLKLVGDAKALNIGSDFASLATANLSGTTTLDLSQKEPQFQTDSTLNLTGVQSDQYGELESGDWEGNVIASAAGAFQVQGNLALEALNPLGIGVIQNVTATEISADQQRIVMQSLQITGAAVTLERAANGDLVMLSRLPGNQSSATDSPDSGSESEPSTGPEVSIQTVILKGSRVDFVDRSVEPLVDLSLSKMNAEIEGFSLQETFKFNFIAEHQVESDIDSELKINGDLALASQTGTIDIDLANFELYEIASYLGGGIRSGRLQLKSNVQMNQGRLVVANDVRIRNVKIDDRAEAGGGDQMSLATALFLLKDSDDVVELKVPIETDFDNFEVGTSDIIQTAMLKAARTTAVAYAQYALQPFGSLLLARDLLGAVTRLRFEPIAFSAGSAELNGKAKSYAEKLSELLVNKGELTVTVCGFAQTSELSMLPEVEEEPSAAPAANKVQEPSESNSPDASVSDLARLKSLALSRSQNVREVLQAGGVKPERIYACTSSVGSTGTPRVEIAL